MGRLEPQCTNQYALLMVIIRGGGGEGRGVCVCVCVCVCGWVGGEGSGSQVCVWWCDILKCAGRRVTTKRWNATLVVQWAGNQL